MFIATKRCGRIVFFSLVVLAVIWIIGNLLIDVQFEGTADYAEKESGSSAATLREVFEGLPAAGEGTGRIELLDVNSDAWAARWRLLAEARDKLEVSYFILDGDIFGISFLGHLLHKARHGTRIRMLLDTIGTTLSREIKGNDYLDALAATGNVRIKMYRPYLFRYRDAFLTLNPLAIIVSYHDKILIADGMRALIGGRNIGRDYLADPGDYARSFRDADLLLTGRRMASALEAVFHADFESEKARAVEPEAVDIIPSEEDLILAYEAMDAWLRGKPFPKKTVSMIREKGFSWLDDLKKLPGLRGVLKKKPAQAITARVRLLDSRPRLLRTDDPISRSLERLAHGAHREIFIQIPYLILSKQAVSVFEQAAKRGVRITILTNGPLSSDNPLSQAFFLEQWPRIMERVPTLRLFVAGDAHNIHGKIGVIDRQLALIGTYNLDPLSMSLNGELMAAVWSATLAEQLLERPSRLIAGGAPRTYEYRIDRDEKGRARRGADGDIVIAFGPEDHSSPHDWKTVQWYRKLVRLAEKLPGTGRLLWK